MSICSSTLELPSNNIYTENITDETTQDLCMQNLKAIPEFHNNLLRVLYLQENEISCIPDDFFPSLPNLMWLDLRDNLLTEIPTSIQGHPSLTHLLLQNNKLTALPNELGTVKLKVLQLKGNCITYPPKEILTGGVKKILDFLNNKYLAAILSRSDLSEDATSEREHFDDINPDVISYNSVIDGDELHKNKALSIQFSEKDLNDSDDELYAKFKGKCPKLAKSRHQIPTYYQSSKYVVPSNADGKQLMGEKIKDSFFKGDALKKHKEKLAMQEKILQGRRNLESLRNWRQKYCNKQQFADPNYKMVSNNFPYDTSPEYMTVLSREDIEKDLPDKFRKNLIRRSKQTIPRKTSNDVHLAMKIKKLFENLEAIDLNRDNMTPRTEQKMLLGEIEKISEIKQKLSELTSSNGRSVIVE